MPRGCSACGARGTWHVSLPQPPGSPSPPPSSATRFRHPLRQRETHRHELGTWVAVVARVVLVVAHEELVAVQLQHVERAHDRALTRAVERVHVAALEEIENVTARPPHVRVARGDGLRTLDQARARALLEVGAATHRRGPLRVASGRAALGAARAKRCLASGTWCSAKERLGVGLTT